ncbi:MAG: hypothetical protein MUF75_02790 [Bacteroidia bacterium]|jgi:hypothetical protein|nr:hypothetical protein [Bacteroidia bacterium]
MTFDKIHSNTNCDCLAKAVIDTSSEFVRKLRKDTVEDKDFLTHWEREIRPATEDCETICSYKGVSINQMTPEYETQILEKYKTTFTINPKKGAHYMKFRLSKDSGKVNYTPEEDDKSHFNLYKADEFTLEKITVLETVKFA